MAEPQAPAPTTTGTDPAVGAGNGALDPEAVALAKAIGRQESHGDPDVINDSGHWGLYQYDKGTWAADAKAAGVDAPWGSATPDQQNQVAYTKIKALKDQGLDPGQIASQWYTGKPDLWNSNKPQKGGAPTPADYAKSVYGYYQQARDDPTFRMRPTGTPSPSSPATAGAPALAPVGGQPSAPEAGETGLMEPSGPDQTPVVTDENVAPSAGPANPYQNSPNSQAVMPGPGGDPVYDAAFKQGQQDADFGGSALMGAEQGALLGTAPYVAAGADWAAQHLGINPAAATPQSFQANLSAERGLYAGHEAAYPLTSILGNVAGAGGAAKGLITKGPAIMRMGAEGTGIFKTLGKAGLVGGTLAAPGNIAGAVSGQVSPTDAAIDEAFQTAGSALLGPIGLGLMKAGLLAGRKIGSAAGKTMFDPGLVANVAKALGMDSDTVGKAAQNFKTLTGSEPPMAAFVSPENAGEMYKLAQINPKVAAAAADSLAESLEKAQAAGQGWMRGNKSSALINAETRMQGDRDFGALKNETINLTPKGADTLMNDQDPTSVRMALGNKYDPALAQRIGSGQITGQDYDTLRQGLRDALDHERALGPKGNPAQVQAAMDKFFNDVTPAGDPRFQGAVRNMKLGYARGRTAEIGESVLDGSPVDDFKAKLLQSKLNGEYSILPGQDGALRSGAISTIGTRLVAPETTESTLKTLANNKTAFEKLKLALGPQEAAQVRAKAMAYWQGIKAQKLSTPARPQADTSEEEETERATHAISSVHGSVWQLARTILGKAPPARMNVAAQTAFNKVMFSGNAAAKEQALKMINAHANQTLFKNQAAGIAAAGSQSFTGQTGQ